MPGVTPNFAIRYPCAGETINPTVFQDFADDVEDALASVQVASTAALQRPRAATRNSSATGTACTVAVLTTMTFTIVDFSSGVTTTATGFTILAGGVYMVDAQFAPINTVTNSPVSCAGSIVQNATTRYRRKISNFGNTTVAFTENVSGLISCAPADTISAQYLWTGAGGPLNVYSRLSISKICDL